MFGTLADVISGWTKGRIPFKRIIAALSVVCGLGALGGVARIAFIAGPLFMLIYPATITMTLLSLAKNFVPNDGAWKGAIFMAVIIGAYDSYAIMKAMGLISFSFTALDNLYAAIPLSGYGFAWVVPTIIGFCIGGLIFKKRA